jgi:hypothetical protein
MRRSVMEMDRQDGSFTPTSTGCPYLFGNRHDHARGWARAMQGETDDGCAPIMRAGRCGAPDRREPNSSERAYYLVLNGRGCTVAARTRKGGLWARLDDCDMKPSHRTEAHFCDGRSCIGSREELLARVQRQFGGSPWSVLRRSDPDRRRRNTRKGWSLRAAISLAPAYSSQAAERRRARRSPSRLRMVPLRGFETP